MITLNDGQAAASALLHEFIAGPVTNDTIAIKSNKYQCIIGGGGTGKTTSIFATLAEYPNKKICLCAPTNKAVRVMVNAAKAHGRHYEAMTLARMLGVAVLPDETTKYSAQVGRARLEDYDIIVLDEGSMASRKTCDILERDADKLGVKIIIMGDSYQLPPVKESVSEAFQMGPTFELTKVERHGGQILEFAKYIRTCIDTGKKIKSVPGPDGTGTHMVTPALGASFVREALEHIDPEDTDKCRLLAWTNNRVDELNKAVRQHFHGRKVPEYLVGDRVIATNSVKSGDVILMPVDEECVVKAVQDDLVVSPFNQQDHFQVWSLVLSPVHTENPTDVVVHVMKAAERGRWDEHLQDVANWARGNKGWKQYWEVAESVHSIKHCYALTIHRSQGSTFNTVFLDVIDVQRQKNLQDQLRLMYVGVTRASHQLFINRQKFLV